jgi:hypothetical protein
MAVEVTMAEMGNRTQAKRNLHGTIDTALGGRQRLQKVPVHAGKIASRLEIQWSAINGWRVGTANA